MPFVHGWDISHSPILSATYMKQVRSLTYLTYSESGGGGGG